MPLPTRFIAHRGNIRGSNPERENHPEYIKEALKAGYEVEIDVWYIREKYYLGHDEPTYPVSLNFLTSDPRMWCHAKNRDALIKLLRERSINCFWHQEDDFTITSHGYIWSYPGQPQTRVTVMVMPDWDKKLDLDQMWKYGYGMAICSDEVERIRRGFKKHFGKKRRRKGEGRDGGGDNAEQSVNGVGEE